MRKLQKKPENLSLFYKRLRNQGKLGKLALVAVMRKLLCIVNSVMKRKTPWQSSYLKSA